MLSVSCGQDYHFLWDALGWPDRTIIFPFSAWHVLSLRMVHLVVLHKNYLETKFNLNLCPSIHMVHMLTCVSSACWPQECHLLHRGTFQPLTGIWKKSIMRQLFLLSLSYYPGNKSQRKATCGDVELQPSQTYMKGNTVWSASPLQTGRENNSSQTIMTICRAHTQGIANLQNTAHKLKSVTILSTPQQALWPMHIDQQTPSNF